MKEWELTRIKRNGAVEFREIINKSSLKRYFYILYIPQIVNSPNLLQGSL